MTTHGNEIGTFDEWLNDGPQAKVALVRKERLRPVAGEGGVIFPPTFAGKDESTYVIDDLPGGRSVIMDTVGSQANRMEALFTPPGGPLQDLVPQIEFTVSRGEGKAPITLNLLDAGHRAADALVRFSDLAPEVSRAFQAIDGNRDYVPLARISPLSLVFGVWDSRGFSGSRIKVPRMVTSTVRAHDITVVHRAAQFIPAIRKKMEKDEIEELAGVFQDTKLSEDGLAEAPSYGLGGIVSRGPIIREAVLSLAALRNLRGPDDGATLQLRRYVLGLALLSLTTPLSPEYRSGCILVPHDPKEPAALELVSRDGTISPCTLGEIAKFARDGATAFGLPKEARKMTFDWKVVKDAVKAKKEKRTPKE
jgi:CRISPR-associated protein Csb1